MDQAFALLNPKGYKKQIDKKGTKATKKKPGQQSIALRYDPTKLLNPRGSQAMEENPNKIEDSSKSIKPEANQEFEFTSTSTRPQNDEDHMLVDASEPVVMSSLIEKMHNVKEREARPAKRLKLKTDDEDPKTNKSTFDTGGSGGIISSHIDEFKKQVSSAENVTNINEQNDNVTNISEQNGAINDEHEVVDLLGESDGDIMATAVKDAANREVCYGRIQDAKIMAYKVPTPFKWGEKTIMDPRKWPRIKISLRKVGTENDLVIIASDPYRNDFGRMDKRTAVVLSRLMGNQAWRIRLDARLLVFTREKDQKPGNPISQEIGVEVVLYGPFKHVDAIGQLFTSHQIWLVAPMVALSVGTELANPHTNRIQSSKAKSFGRSVFRTEEEVSRDIRGLFDEFPKTELLEEMEPPKTVITPLLPHQKQALYWMTELEKLDKQGSAVAVSLWKTRTLDNGSQEWYHAITGKRQLEQPKDPRGGILADEMGLGKTLEVLALICSSKQAATNFQNLTMQFASDTFFEHTPAVRKGGKLLKFANKPVANKPQNTKPVMCRRYACTLIVCPLSVISNWEDQVRTHTPSLRLFVYHGATRPDSPEMLAEYDIIVTTYSIIKNELIGDLPKHAKSPLRQMAFFRIILDEAHTIRGQSTLQSQAACFLQGQRRWALTGTPVQNRLEDLGTLLVYLRLKPFDQAIVFREHILLPLKLAKIDIVDKLRAVVDSVTLRRLKNNLELPEKKVETVLLDFSEEEQKLYQRIAVRAQQELSAIEEKKPKNTQYIHVFRLTLCLRQIAAHKGELLSFNDFIESSGDEVAIKSANHDEGLADEDETITPPLPKPSVAYELFDTWNQTNAAQCTKCARAIDIEDEESETFGYIMSCFQLLCSDCGALVAKELAVNATKYKHDCPFCEERVNAALLPLVKDELVQARVRQNKAMEFTNTALRARYMEPSTKVKYLLQDLQKHADLSEEHPDEAPIKSVVFSIWTGHLDLIEIALEDHGFDFTRLNGKMSLSKRRQNLAKFRDDPSCNIILVSMGAGGVGLNLTSASKVYMMDYGFNPAALEQAVDRVHRLGQLRDVTVKLLVMKTSIEENILKLQRMKAELADLSLNKQSGTGQTIQSRLDQLKALFNRRIG